MTKTSKKGFTLAEVLTTLMVIGVVAAMTIPTLMNSTDEQQKKASYRKAMSVLGQATQLLVAREDEETVADSADLATFMQNVMTGTLTSETSTGAGGVVKNVLQTPDGMAFQFIYRPKGDIPEYKRTLKSICGDASDLFGSDPDEWAAKDAECIVVIDVNGLGKGSTSFKTAKTTHGTAVTASDTMAGTDQFPVLLTGDGVRPIWIDGAADLNKGYEYIYGDGSYPDTTS